MQFLYHRLTYPRREVINYYCHRRQGQVARFEWIEAIHKKTNNQIAGIVKKPISPRLAPFLQFLYPSPIKDTAQVPIHCFTTISGPCHLLCKTSGLKQPADTTCKTRNTNTFRFASGWMNFWRLANIAGLQVCITVDEQHAIVVACVDHLHHNTRIIFANQEVLTSKAELKMKEG